MSSDSEHGQVSSSAAEVYEEFFVPALFGQWPEPILEGSGIGPGARVLDVACGTGVLAREALTRIGPGGRVSGVDINPGMLAVARRLAPQIDWRQGPAEALAFDDAGLDAVLSQFGLMFFADRCAAIGEMLRVLSPGGRLAVAVWDGLERTPGYAAMVALLERLFGRATADALRAPFVLGDPAALGGLFDGAPLDELRVSTHSGTARFPSIAAWVHTDIRGWTLADRLDDDQVAALTAAAERELREFTAADGSVAFPAPAHILSATRAAAGRAGRG